MDFIVNGSIQITLALVNNFHIVAILTAIAFVGYSLCNKSKKSIAGIMWGYVALMYSLVSLVVYSENYFSSLYIGTMLQSEEFLQDHLSSDFGDLTLLLNNDDKISDAISNYMIVPADNGNKKLIYYDRVHGNSYDLLTINPETTSQQSPQIIWPTTITFTGNQNSKTNNFMLFIICLITLAGGYLWFLCWRNITRQLNKKMYILGMTCVGILLAIPIYLTPVSCFLSTKIPLDYFSSKTKMFHDMYNTEQLDKIIATTSKSGIVNKELFIGKKDFFEIEFARYNIDHFDYIYYFPTETPNLIADKKANWINIYNNVWLKEYKNKQDLLLNYLFMILYILVAVISASIYIYVTLRKQLYCNIIKSS